ncbi:31591_t:CDS:2, partial [Racocetra persica]
MPPKHLTDEERRHNRSIVNYNNYNKNQYKIIKSHLKISEIQSLQERDRQHEECVKSLEECVKVLETYIQELKLIPSPPTKINSELIWSSY